MSAAQEAVRRINRGEVDSDEHHITTSVVRMFSDAGMGIRKDTVTFDECLHLMQAIAADLGGMYQDYTFSADWGKPNLMAYLEIHRTSFKGVSVYVYLNTASHRVYIFVQKWSPNAV